MAKVGTVYLVGAGPGHPELISIKGQRLLQLCHAVIYDHLVPDELLITLPVGIEMHYVGKRAGQHTLSQDQINELMVKLAREGKEVVRLKGGDPFIFGRGAEEAGYLKSRGIKFEVVPGITAGIAAPAYAGIPCTDRRKAPFVIFATGHKAREKEGDGIPWQTLAQAEGGTLVIYMGVKEIVKTISKLIAAGMAVDTPAAIIQRGTHSGQKVITGPLKAIPDLAAAHSVRPPSLFVIGKVVELRSQVNWLEGKPLLGINVMVTRAADQATGLYQALRRLGADVLASPTIATRENDDTEGWRMFSYIASAHRWLVFTSENGVRYFIKQFMDRYGDIRALSDYRIAAIGEGTARALRERMLRVDFIPSQATVARLSEEFLGETESDDISVVRVRGDLSDAGLEQRLRELGVHCVPITVYRTSHPAWPTGMKEKLFDYPPDVIIFTSSSTVKGLLSILSSEEIARLTEDCLIVSIGPSTSRTAAELGLPVAIEAKPHTIDEVVKLLVNHFSKNRQE